MKARAPLCGFGLLEALVALAVLAFGMLGMTRFQARMVAQASETQARTTAVQLSDELLNTALVDVGNAACYTYPATGTCGSNPAKARTAAWAAAVAAALPGSVSVTSTLGNDQRLTVSLSWTGKGSQDSRSLVAMTDVRP